MDTDSKIASLQVLKNKLTQLSLDKDFLYRVEAHNPWFIPRYTLASIQSICNQYLDESKLRIWLGRYPLTEKEQTTGLILAGNIPLVGFHDILCGYFTSQKLNIKLSSKDNFLTSHVLNLWSEIDPDWKNRMTLVDKIEDCTKVIATGSNNTYKYFEFYFKKYKHILRKNRTSIAIVPNNISDEELNYLIDDIFLYFGLGCRNVSKLWIEKGFDLGRIFEASERYNFLFEHTKYMNNYDYQRTLLLLNKIPHLSNNFLMLREDSSLYSPISVVNYELYNTQESIDQFINQHREEIQCVIGRDNIPFGKAQSPELWDYADGVDTMQFLLDD